jgi:hypothetical protein
MTKKIFVAIIISIALLVFALFVALSSIDYNLVFQNYLKDSSININAKNIAQIKLHKLPIPYLTIDSVKEDGQIELNNIEVRFALSSLIKFAPKIESLKIAKAKLYFANDNLTIINHDLFIKNLIARDKLNINIYIDDLYCSASNNATIARINNFFLTKSEGKLNHNLVKGNIVNLGGFVGSFERNDDNITNFNLNIKNDNCDMQLSEIYKDSALAFGKVELKITELSAFLQNNFPDLASLFKEIKSNEVVDIRFDIIPTQDFLQCKNLVIESSLIQGNGKIDISKNNTMNNLLTLNLSKMDIESIINSQNINKSTKVEIPKYPQSWAKSKQKGNFIATDISINKIILNETESFNGVKLISNFENGVFVIKDLSGSIESGGEFKISGNITNNNFRNVFDGNLYLKHENFNKILSVIGCDEAVVKTVAPFILSSDLKLTLIDLYFNNLLFKTDNVRVAGNVSTKFIGSKPHITASLGFSSMDIGRAEYPIVSPVIEFTKSLFDNMKDKEYLNKFIPIRTLSYIGNLDLTFTDLMFNDKYVGNINILTSLSPGNIKINNLDINNGSNFLFSSWALEASGIKPKLDIAIENGLLNVDFLTPSSWLTLRHKLYNDFSLDKIALTLDCFISTIYQNDTRLDNLKFLVNNDNTLLNISNLNVGIFDGNLQGSGSILLEPHTANFVYALNSIDISKLLGILPKNLMNNTGSASINGMFSTRGDTVEKLLYNLYTKSSIITKNLTIPNFGIDNFLEKITLPQYNVQNVKADSSNAITTGTTEIETLNSDIELTQGMAVLNNVTFKTKYASGSAALGVNLYDFSMNLSSIFSFYPIADSKNNPSNVAKIGVKAVGSIFEPKKTVEINELVEFLTKNAANKSRY